MNNYFINKKIEMDFEDFIKEFFNQKFISF